LNVTVTRVFPLGHSVEILSSVALEGETLWPEHAARFDTPPLQFVVEIAPGDDSSPLNFLPAPLGFGVQCGETGQGTFDIATRAGTLRASQASLARLLETLVLTALDWTFFVGIHAGCVMRAGKSVLLCGDSGAGKSTLAYACSQSGWDYVSDNSLHWASAPHDVLVSGSPEIRLREGARRLFSLDGAVSVPWTPCAPAGPCVFLIRRPGPARLRPHSTQDAMTYFGQYDTRPDRAYAEDRYRALLGHGAWVLEYEDVWDAVGCLETLL
jgi:hypothetical protein